MRKYGGQKNEQEHQKHKRENNSPPLYLARGNVCRRCHIIPDRDGIGDNRDHGIFALLIEGELNDVKIEKYTFLCDISLSFCVLVGPQKSGVEFNDINRFRVVIACCKTEQNNDLFFIIDAADSYCIGVFCFYSIYIRNVYKQPFGYFFIRACKVRLL